MPALNLPARFVDAALDRLIVPGYTKAGYLIRSRFWDELPPDAMRGKRVLVTGANRGIGKGIATGLAGLGADVHLAVRDKKRGEGAMKDIRRDVPGARLHVERLDIGRMADVRRFVAEFTSRVDSLDAVVHNAGLMPHEREETGEGHEVMLAVHVLGPHLLTKGLLPALENAKGRVIWESSGGMYGQKLPAGDYEYREGDYRPTAGYARTKRMQIVLAEMWAERLRASGVVVHSTHPGWVDTEGVKTSLPTFYKLIGPAQRNDQQGADTTVWLCAADEPGECTGLFWHDRRPRPTHYLPTTHDTAGDRERLWDWCEAEVPAP